MANHTDSTTMNIAGVAVSTGTLTNFKPSITQYGHTTTDTPEIVAAKFEAVYPGSCIRSSSPNPDRPGLGLIVTPWGPMPNGGERTGEDADSWKITFKTTAIGGTWVGHSRWGENRNFGCPWWVAFIASLTETQSHTIHAHNPQVETCLEVLSQVASEQSRLPTRRSRRLAQPVLNPTAKWESLLEAVNQEQSRM